MKQNEYTGEVVTVDAYNRTKSVGKRCNIKVTVGNREFSRETVAQPGEEISWTAMLSFDPYVEEEQFIPVQTTLTEEDHVGGGPLHATSHGGGTVQTSSHDVSGDSYRGRGCITVCDTRTLAS